MGNVARNQEHSSKILLIILAHSGRHFCALLLYKCICVWIPGPISIWIFCSWFLKNFVAHAFRFLGLRSQLGKRGLNCYVGTTGLEFLRPSAISECPSMLSVGV